MPKSKINDDSLLSSSYLRFFQRFGELDSIPLDKWTVTHTIIYIVKKYEEKFKMKFVLTYTEPLSNSPEYRLTVRLWNMLEAKRGDGKIVKDYIDFFYDNYKSKKQFFSIGALAKEKNISIFKLHEEKVNKPNRNTPLPDKFVSIVSKFDETKYIKTYGDLAFLKEAMAENDNIGENLRTMFRMLKDNGLKISVLNNME